MTQIRQTKPRLTDDPNWTGWKDFHAMKTDKSPHLEQSIYHVERFADRLKRGDRPAMGQGMIDMAMACWRSCEAVDAVKVIAAAYPRELPMTRVMGAE